jgi:hypothetical protein
MSPKSKEFKNLKDSCPIMERIIFYHGSGLERTCMRVRHIPLDVIRLFLSNTLNTYIISLFSHFTA